MSSNNDDTILPARRPVNSGGLDGDTVLPSQNAPGIHAPGDVIDNRYTVIREIGRGGMGVVYEVEDRIATARYAIKRLLPTSAANEQIVRAFFKEGTVAETFSASSGHFVTTKSIGMDTYGYYSVMELIRVPTLRQVLKSSGRLNPDIAIPILMQVAKALATLHDTGLIHRDLKPENIFVADAEENPAVKLVDFGLTRHVSSNTITGLGGAGSLRYMAPELFRDEPATKASDVYAFGVIAYELLNGDPPLGLAQPVHDIVPDLEPAWASLISDCLSPQTNKRPDLRKVIDNLRLPAVMYDTGSSSVTIAAVTKQTPHVVRGQMTSTLRIDAQDGCEILIDGTRLLPPYRFSIFGMQQASTLLNLSVTWHGFSVFQGQVSLRAGQTETIKVDRAIRLTASLPDWCEVVTQHGLIELPFIGLQSDLKFIELSHSGLCFDRFDLTDKIGDFDVPLRIVRLIGDIPAGGELLTNIGHVNLPFVGFSDDLKFVTCCHNGKEYSTHILDKFVGDYEVTFPMTTITGVLPDWCLIRASCGFISLPYSGFLHDIQYVELLYNDATVDFFELPLGAKAFEIPFRLIRIVGYVPHRCNVTTNIGKVELPFVGISKEIKFVELSGTQSAYDRFDVSERVGDMEVHFPTVKITGRLPAWCKVKTALGDVRIPLEGYPTDLSFVGLFHYGIEFDQFDLPDTGGRFSIPCRWIRIAGYIPNGCVVQTKIGPITLPFVGHSNEISYVHLLSDKSDFGRHDIEGIMGDYEVTFPKIQINGRIPAWCEVTSNLGPISLPFEGYCSELQYVELSYDGSIFDRIELEDSLQKMVVRLQHGLASLTSELPISVNVVDETHAVLRFPTKVVVGKDGTLKTFRFESGDLPAIVQRFRLTAGKNVLNPFDGIDAVSIDVRQQWERFLAPDDTD